MNLIDKARLRHDSKLREELNSIKWRAKLTYTKEKDKNKLETLNKSVDNMLEIISTDCEVDDKEILNSFKSVIRQCKILQKRGKKPVKVKKGFLQAAQIGLEVFTIALVVGSIGGVIGFLIWAVIHWGWWALSLGVGFFMPGLVEVGILGLLHNAVNSLEDIESNIDCYDVSLENEEFAHVSELSKEFENQQNPELLPAT